MNQFVDVQRITIDCHILLQICWSVIIHIAHMAIPIHAILHYFLYINNQFSSNEAINEALKTIGNIK